MSFFPLLPDFELSSFLDIHNFAPNNWQFLRKQSRHVYAHWSSSGLWHHKLITSLPHNSSIQITRSYLNTLTNLPSDVFLSLQNSHLPDFSDNLNNIKQDDTTIPSWRSTIGYSSRTATTSFQGELFPFRSPGSFLSFNDLVQTHHPLIQNFLVFINLNISPNPLISQLFISPIDSELPLHSFTVRSNKCNFLHLPNKLISMCSSRLKLWSNNMSGVPLFLSCSHDYAQLSLEHTHPPASLALGVQRFTIQNIIKSTFIP